METHTGANGLTQQGKVGETHSGSHRKRSEKTWDLAEGVGFEPTELSLYGFQDRRHRPLGHPSKRLKMYHKRRCSSTLTPSESLKNLTTHAQILKKQPAKVLQEPSGYQNFRNLFPRTGE